MKTSVYLLEKDLDLTSKISKRFMIETTSELKGSSNDASSSYSEIQNIKPDILVFGYPMNFTIDQLMIAMNPINPKMKYVALLESGYEGYKTELEKAGVTDIFFKSSLDLTNLIQRIQDISIRLNPQVSNPFASTSQPQNPFGSQPNQNPFGQQPSKNPFGNTQSQGSFGNMQQSAPQQAQTSQPFNIGGMNIGGQQFEQNGFINVDQQISYKTMKQTLIAIHCPKGGVGKTSISTNLAVLLSTVKMGKQPLSVLLVDMDWAFGDVCVNLGIQPRPNVINWVNDIKARKNLNENADMNFTQGQIEKYLINYKTGLKILAAPSSHNDSLEITEDMGKIIIDNLKNNCNFDIIIFDCGNNTDTHTLQALLAVHSVYEVTTMDVSAMNELSNLMATLKSISFPINKIKLIVNRLPKTGAEFKISEISDALNLQTAGVIHDNEKVRVHNNSGEPIVLSNSTNSFSEELKQIANTMLGNNLFTKKSRNNEQVEKTSFLSRIFKRR